MDPKYGNYRETGLEAAYQAERSGNFNATPRPMPEDMHMNEVEVLKVSGKSRPSSVAGAIAGVVRQAGRVEIQAIGAGATNQAIKAVAIARGYLISSGIDIVCVPAFIDVTIDDEERTAIKLLVERRPGFSGPSTSPVM
jgi:stage V sporulation protein S